MADDPITAALDQLARHAEQIATQAGDLTEATARTAKLAALMQALDQRVSALATRIDQITPDDTHVAGAAGQPYAPSAARRWWKLTGQDREQAVAALRAWVDQVYRPGYGQLAATLGPCWDQHPLCLYAIDILSELWSVLYLTGTRTPALLTMQAEYQARILPALAEQMSAATTRCRHHIEPRPASGQARRPA